MVKKNAVQNSSTRTDKRRILTLFPTEQENLLTQHNAIIYKICKCKRYTMYIRRKTWSKNFAWEYLKSFCFSLTIPNPYHFGIFPVQQLSEYKIRHAEPKDEMQLTKVKKQNKHYWCIVQFVIYNRHWFRTFLQRGVTI